MPLSPRRSSATPSADDTWTMCTRASNSVATRTIRRMASTSACGWTRREVGCVSPVGCVGPGAASDTAGDSACTSSGTLRRARIGSASRRSVFAHRGKFVDARRHEEALEAADAGVDQRVELPGVARHDAAPEPDVDVALRARRFPLRVAAPPPSSSPGRCSAACRRSSSRRRPRPHASPCRILPSRCGPAR